jgi:O-acetyl-ADP-ribose deacetylase (regulator of RNase III)
MTSFAAGFKLRELRGHIFYSVDCSLAHCVSADANLRSGIGAQFRKTFDGIVEEIKAQNVGVGGVAVTNRYDNHYVYSLVTRAHVRFPYTYNALASSLTAMREHMVANKVTSLAIPRIGCDDLDAPLQWSRVRDIITEVFKNTNVLITVYFPIVGSTRCYTTDSDWPKGNEPEMNCLTAQSQRHSQILVQPDLYVY